MGFLVVTATTCLSIGIFLLAVSFINLSATGYGRMFEAEDAEIKNGAQDFLAYGEKGVILPQYSFIQFTSSDVMIRQGKYYYIWVRMTSGGNNRGVYLHNSSHIVLSDSVIPAGKVNIGDWKWLRVNKRGWPTNFAFFYPEIIGGIIIKGDGAVGDVYLDRIIITDNAGYDPNMQCSDGVDNDDDGLIDLDDAGCLGNSSHNTETQYDSDSWTIINGQYTPATPELNTTYIMNFYPGMNPHVYGELKDETSNIVAQDACFPFNDNGVNKFIVEEFFYVGRTIHETFFQCDRCDPSGKFGIGSCIEVSCNAQGSNTNNTKCYGRI